MADEIDKWLTERGFGHYARVFTENDVDFEVLPHLTNEDLKDLGVSKLGDRKKILLAIGKLADSPNSPTQIQNVPVSNVPTLSDPNAERRQVTVLFADLVGSTSLSRKVDAEVYRELIRKYQDLCAQAVARYGGFVAQYMGDGVMVYFGWPKANEDDAERAINVAIDLVNKIQGMQRDVAVPLAVRIGIATGRVVIGDIIGEGASQQAAISGEAPNLAARLQSLAGPNETVIAGSTHAIAGGFFDCTDLGLQNLKGYDVPSKAWRVDGARTVETRFLGQRRTVSVPLVGRLTEQQTLQDRWQSALQGNGQVVLISGDAGIGKSRLVDTLLADFLETPLELVRLQCSPYHSASAFHPIAERILRSASIQSEDSNDVRASKIEAMLHATPQQVPQAFGIYSELLSMGEKTPRDIASLSPQDLKEQTIQTIVDRTAAMAKDKPVLMLVEDSHWIDPSTQEVLERLTSSIADLPALMIVTQRPEGESEWVRDFDNTTLLSIGLLNRDQTTELVTHVLDETPDVMLIDDIEARAGGVPFFVEELARSIAESDPGDSDATIPETLQSSLMARLDRLQREPRNLALVASVIGREFDPGLLARVLSQTAEHIDNLLGELARARIVVASATSPGGRMFRHALIQDTAYQSMLSRTRRAHHLAIAQALETGFGDVVEREPEVIARHYSEAGISREAISYWAKAAERALAHSANFEATVHAKAACAHAELLEDVKEMNAAKISTGILLGRTLESAGELLEAYRVLLDTTSKARKQNDINSFSSAVVHFTDVVALAAMPEDQSIVLLEEALELISSDDEPMRCALLSNLARCSQMTGDKQRASRSRVEALGLARKLDDKQSLCKILFSEFLTPVGVRESIELGSWREKLDEMITVAEDLDDGSKARSQAIEAFVSAEMGDRDRMDNAIEQLLVLGQGRQHMHTETIAKHGFSMKAILDSDFTLAEQYATDAFNLAQKSYGTSMEGVHGMQMFTIRREQARLAQIAPVIRKMLDDDPTDSAWKPGFAIVASDLGHEAAAERMLREMAETDFDFALDAKYSTTLGYLAEVCTEVADPELTERLYDLLHPYEDMTITAGALTVCLGAASRHLGKLCSAVGEWDRAEQHFDVALNLNREMRSPLWTAWTQHDIAQMYLKRERPKDRMPAQMAAQEALDAANKLGMVRLKQSCSTNLIF